MPIHIGALLGARNRDTTGVRYRRKGQFRARPAHVAYRRVRHRKGNRMIKGSMAAKRYMAKLRRMRKH